MLFFIPLFQKKFYLTSFIFSLELIIYYLWSISSSYIYLVIGAYFFSDGLSILFWQKEKLIPFIHHLVGFYVWYFCYQTEFEIYFLTSSVIVEASTPWLSIYRVKSIEGSTEIPWIPSWYSRNVAGLVFMFFFFLFRFVVLSRYLLTFENWILLQFRLPIIFFYLLNSYWFSLMIKSVIKQLVKQKKIIYNQKDYVKTSYRYLNY